MNDGGDTSATLPPRIGRYRVTGMLGRGAMGVVYRAHDAAIDREVAIKTIHRRLLRGEEGAEWLERFRREVRAAGRCVHPNIVTVFEYGEEAGAPYIVMEYVQGRELRSYLKDRPVPTLHRGTGRGIGGTPFPACRACASTRSADVAPRSCRSGGKPAPPVLG